MNAKELFQEYVSRYDKENGRIELKVVHTFAVADVMDRLTAALHLTERQRYFAHICAMFHDIGRFEQVRRFDTFMDHQSVDHAWLGCEVLKEEKLLEELDSEEQRMVLTAIGNHNRLQIEDGLDEETLLLCKLIRDADKCDIFRVFACEEMVDTMGETVEQVAKETISETVYNSIFSHRCVKREERQTGLDIWISFLAFFFDLYFKESIEIVLQDGYYRQLFDSVEFADADTRKQVKEILQEIETYIRKRLGK